MVNNYKIPDLDLLASEVGGYVEQLTDFEESELSNYNLRAACEFATKLGRPLTTDEFNMFKN